MILILNCVSRTSLGRLPFLFPFSSLIWSEMLWETLRGNEQSKIEQPSKAGLISTRWIYLQAFGWCSSVWTHGERNLESTLHSVERSRRVLVLSCTAIAESNSTKLPRLWQISCPYRWWSSPLGSWKRRHQSHHWDSAEVDRFSWWILMTLRGQTDLFRSFQLCPLCL